MRARQTIATTAGLLVVLLSAATARAQPGAINAFACGPISPPGQFGPFDYRTVPTDIKHRVEDYHFPPKVERQLEGNTGPFGADVDYTLRAFPNNPRALLSLTRYSTTRHQEMVPGAHYTTECYFDRAFRWQPDDPMPHLIYAVYLKDRGRKAEAKRELDEAEKLRGDPTNFDFDYNLGILYSDLGDYDQAMVAAKRAYALGAPLPALQNRLKKAGKWQD